MLLVGCEPASTEERIGLSAPVTAAVDEAVRIVLDLVRAAEPARGGSVAEGRPANEGGLSPETDSLPSGADSLPAEADRQPAAATAVDSEGIDHMCLGIPGEVIEFIPDQPDLARVDVSGVRRVINIGLLSDDPPKPGEWVLIHVGFALSKIDEAEAAAAMQFLEGIGQAYEDELAALAESRIE